MELLNNTKDNTSYLSGNGFEYTLDYGEIKKGANGVLDLYISFDKTLVDIRVSVSCGGCTKARIVTQNIKDANIQVEYDTTILGNINKKVYITYSTEDAKNKRVNINLKGNVKK